MATKLLDEMRDLMRRRHYSIHTERAYRDWVKRYARFHNMQSRDDLHPGEEKIGEEKKDSSERRNQRRPRPQTNQDTYCPDP